MKSTILYLFLLTNTLLSCQSTDRTKSKERKNDDVIIVEYPETYELANIIIALTEDGLNDKWKVKKNFPYYEKMIKHFKPMENHPLLDSVNFERKRWKEFLSFRTDSYAYRFDEKGKLKRINNFYSFDISEFDDHADLVQDFAIKSNFREFFKVNEDFHAKMVSEYKRHYMLQEMKDFLSLQFDELLQSSIFKVVLSPFVGSQHLLREPDSLTTASFADIASQIIDGTPYNGEDKSSIIHTLFTEMDHAFVNPTTSKYEIKNSFDQKLWNTGSGYEEYDNGIFNEYMTWAVFDIFNSMPFPELAGKINLNWHFQNETRGFIYSNLFASKLIELYLNHDGKKEIKDLYPEFLSWIKKIEPSLSKPYLLNDSDTIHIASTKNLIELQFSESLEKVSEFDIVLQYGQWNKDVIRIGENNNLQWDKNQKSLTFEIELPDKNEYYILLNWWGVEKPLKSEKDIMPKATSGFIVKGNSAQNKG